MARPLRFRNVIAIDRDWQRALFLPLTVLAWLAVLVVGTWLLGHVLKTVLTLILAAVIAFAVTPLVRILSRWIPRGIAVAIAYVLALGVVVGMGALVVYTAATEMTNLVHNLPVYQREIQHYQPQMLRVLKPFGVTSAKLHHAQSQVIAYVQSVGTGVARQSFDLVTRFLGTVVDMVLVLILSVYLTANGMKIADWLRREAPNSQRFHVSLSIAIVNQVIGGYVRGQMSLALLVGSLIGLGMFALHVPYALLLGVIGFFMEFVPIIGVFISGAFCIAIALFQGWITALLVLAYFVFVHVIEGDVVGPRIMGHAVGIHPAVALLALVAGTELFGVWGALFGAPIAGLLQAFVTAAYHELRGGDPRAVLNTVTDAADRMSPPTPNAG